MIAHVHTFYVGSLRLASNLHYVRVYLINEGGGGQAGSAWPCAQSWRPNSNFVKKLHKLNANAQYTIVAMSQIFFQASATLSRKNDRKMGAYYCLSYTGIRSVAQYAVQAEKKVVSRLVWLVRPEPYPVSYWEVLIGMHMHMLLRLLLTRTKIGHNFNLKAKIKNPKRSNLFF